MVHLIKKLEALVLQYTEQVAYSRCLPTTLFSCNSCTQLLGSTRDDLFVLNGLQVTTSPILSLAKDTACESAFCSVSSETTHQVCVACLFLFRTINLSCKYANKTSLPLVIENARNGEEVFPPPPFIFLLPPL